MERGSNCRFGKCNLIFIVISTQTNRSHMEDKVMKSALCSIRKERCLPSEKKQSLHQLCLQSPFFKIDSDPALLRTKGRFPVLMGHVCLLFCFSGTLQDRRGSAPSLQHTTEEQWSVLISPYMLAF